MKLFDVKCLNRLNLNSKQTFESYEDVACFSIMLTHPQPKRINVYFNHTFDVDQIFITDRYGRIMADLTNEKTTIYAKPFASTLTDNLLRDPKEFSTNIQMVIDYINQK